MPIMSLKHKSPNAPCKEHSFISQQQNIYLSRGLLGPLPQFNEAPSPNNAPDQDMSTFGYSSICPQQNIYVFNGWFGVLQNGLSLRDISDTMLYSHSLPTLTSLTIPGRMTYKSVIYNLPTIISPTILGLMPHQSATYKLPTLTW